MELFVTFRPPIILIKIICLNSPLYEMLCKRIEEEWVYKSNFNQIGPPISERSKCSRIVICNTTMFLNNFNCIYSLGTHLEYITPPNFFLLKAGNKVKNIIYMYSVMPHPFPSLIWLRKLFLNINRKQLLGKNQENYLQWFY